MIYKRDIEQAAQRLPDPETHRFAGDVMRVALLGPMKVDYEASFSTTFRIAQFRIKKGYCWRTQKCVYWWDFEGIEC